MICIAGAAAAGAAAAEDARVAQVSWAGLTSISLVSPLVRASNVRGLVWYYYIMIVLTSEHKQSLREGVTSTKKSTYIRSTYKREC